MPCQIEQFRIETKSFNRLLFKDDPAPLSPKCLEAALRIHKWQPQYALHDFVEYDSRKFPEYRLVHLNEAPVHGAATDGHIARLQRLEQFFSFFNRRREVRIREQHDLSQRFLRAVTHAKP